MSLTLSYEKLDGKPSERAPLRPIVSTNGSTIYCLVKYRAKLADPLIGNWEHHTKNQKNL